MCLVRCPLVQCYRPVLGLPGSFRTVLSDKLILCYTGLYANPQNNPCPGLPISVPRRD